MTAISDKAIGPAFFLRYTSPGSRGVISKGVIGCASLDAAKATAWDRRRDGRFQPLEILDREMRPVMGKAELREWLDLQDRDWPEIEDEGESLDW